MAKPQWHISALNMLAKCGEAFLHRYIYGEIFPPGVAAVVGTATHKSVRRNLSAKIETGELLGVEAAQECARDALNEEWDKGVLLVDDEKDMGEKKARGEAVDKAVRLARTHAAELAPRLKPTHVERAWTIELPQYPYDIAGALDVQEGDICVRDTKTGAKSPPSNAADVSDQLTMYSMAVKTLDGTAPTMVALDYVVDLKRGGPVIKSLGSYRTTEDYQALLRRIETSANAVEKGVFVPARPEDWWCSPKWCGRYDKCKYVRRRS